MGKFISLCMIVKNEETVIERCLSSVAQLVDEIVVVDTGSTDKTKELVSKYTTNIYDFEWIDDFSAARNFAASKATSEWILVLDADEYVDEENFKRFISDIKEDNYKYDAYNAKILNFSGDFGEVLVQNYHDRIYKNNGDISYFRKIHEQFKHNNGLDIKFKNSNLIIFHSGYLKHTVNEKDKSNRNKKLIDIEMQSNNKNAFDYFNLGNEYSSIGDVNKALESYIEAYKLKSDIRLSWVSTTLIQIIICLMQLKRFNDALNVIKDAESVYTNSPEILYLKGEIFYLRGQMEDAKEIFQEIVSNPDIYDHVIFRPDLKDQKPHSRLGDIYLYEEDYQNAVYHYTSVLNINKYSEKSINNIVYIFNKFHSDHEIKEFLYRSKLINEKNIKYYVHACFDIGNYNLALSILKEIKEENKLLYQVGLLKKLAVEKKVELIDDIQDLFEYSVVKDLIKANWINTVEIYLLEYLVERDLSIARLIEHFKNNNVLIELKRLLNEETRFDNINGGLFKDSLQILINYKQFSICTNLLKHVNLLDPKEQSQVAGILYSNGFRVESIHLYEKIDWSYLTVQDFINIINSLVQTNANDNAVEISKYAKALYPDDFRFYKFIIENTQDISVYSDNLYEANERFKESKFLDRLNITN
ncbi:TPR domain-containing glycosyltransferase [Bacillus sp. AFS040349]|uniref:tetratricopeptide repeat-containing glycosyltransferase family 2 protein n=1 Tax=Bacillus sp. AFS040349 TaxID=2033502 RepID=UPI00159BA637|nr:TPR domain-containing glycosyltransferase [Bacillus sp. AFS040349]